MPIGLPAAAWGDIFSWVDEMGKKHYADDPSQVPPGKRDQIRREKELKPPPRPPAPANEPARKEDAGRASHIEPSREPAPGSGPPPGTIVDQGGNAIRYRGKQWTVEISGFVESWEPGKEWRRTHEISALQKSSLEHAIAEFNKIPGLDLSLALSINPDPGISLNTVWKNKDRFIVYVAMDGLQGTFPRKGPYRWRGTASGDGSYVGGCSIIVRNEKGAYNYWRNDLSAGVEIAGGMLFSTEYTERLLGLTKCGKSIATYYGMLHELGHCLGLGHATPGPSIMKGTCGKSYYPNDIFNFKYLYKGAGR
ncbi:MAG: DUF4124 domain-containing protein [Nitrospinae bacterium]|nr:DUF4124 domain-containing protein [Nitrospinota bacterium]